MDWYFFHTKMNDLRKDGKYWDVKIHVEDKTFLCHRIILASASEYFENMFCGKFKESYDSEVTLNDIDSETFELILEYVYSFRRIAINHSNVFNLLCVSEFLQIDAIAESCIEYIKNHAKSMPNVFEIFLQACATNKREVVNILKKEILKNFYLYWKCDQFMEVDVDDLEDLLCTNRANLLTGLPHQDDNRILDVVIRWVRHSPETRMDYFVGLLDLIRFPRISEEYFMFALKEYQWTYELPQGWKYDPSLFKQYLIENSTLIVNSTAPEYSGCESLPISSTDREFWKKDLTTLHVFATLVPPKCSFLQPPEDTDTTIVSMNSSRSREWFVSAERNLTIYRHDDIQIFTAHHQSNGSLLYYLRTNISLDDQIFRSYSSIDMESISADLTPPPALSAGFEMCGMKENNSIYLYDCVGSYRASKNSTDPAISQVEIDRGILRYNCELDKWFSVPEMKLKTTDSRLVVDNHVLYVVGGVEKSSQAELPRYVQAYDFRTPRWMELSNDASEANLERINDACAVNGKIYVSAVYDREISAFDIVSSKWETVKCSDISEFTYHDKMVSYENKLWVICTTFSGIPIHNTNPLAVYDPVTEEWVGSGSLTQALFAAHRSSSSYRSIVCSCPRDRNIVSERFNIETVLTFTSPE